MSNFTNKNNKKNKLVIVLIGPPGSGKGTQAELLAGKFGLFYFETSKIIEKQVMKASRDDFLKIGGKKYSLVHERDLWKGGILCTPVVVSFLVKNKIKELAIDYKNLMMAGSPRTLYEGEQIMPLLEKLYGKNNIKIFNIILSDKESIRRNSKRRICSQCRHPVPYFKETAILTDCPRCGAKLIFREGLDDPETIKIRLKEYKERTEPLLDYFHNRGLKIIKINGEQSIEDVFQDIVKYIDPVSPKLGGITQLFEKNEDKDKI